MNRKEKRERRKVKIRSAKLIRYRRHGGSSRYARKLAWRKSRLNGCPIPVTGFNTWEDVKKII